MPELIESFCDRDREAARALISRVEGLERRVTELEPKPKKERRPRLPKEGQEDWVTLRSLFGTAKIPGDIADLLKAVIEKMTASGDIGDKNKFQALEYMAAEYLAGAE